jgi:ABC-type bacteriocin/lantibiotic exporter with double-glycine peptidase domain
MGKPAGISVWLTGGLALLVALALLVTFYRPRPEPVRPPDPDAIRDLDPEHPCGTVALALASRLLGRPVPLVTVQKALLPDAMGRNSMREIVECARKLGFGAAGVRLSARELRRLEVPVIAHLAESHWAVLFTNEHKAILLFDPPRPLRSVSPEELDSLWSGAGVVVTEDADSLKQTLARLGIDSQVQ